MKLLSWNVAGYRACLKKGFQEFFEEVDADIVSLQEVKATEEQIDYVPEGYYVYRNIAEKKGYSGVLTYTKVKPIMKCGRLIGNGYSDVFDAIRYNRMLKRAILLDAKNITEKMKGYSTTEELYDDILENWFVEDLIQAKGDEGTEAAEDAEDKNIFDIFLVMKSHMPDSDWDSLFEGLLLTIWEFCEILFDKSAKHINGATKTILREIYNNCSASKIPEKDLPKHKHEGLLSNHYKLLLNRKYENG